MIPTLLRIAFLSLRRDRVVQAMTFLLPIVFFSIFAGVFGSQGREATERIRVAVVDEDGSPASQRLVAGLRREQGLRLRTTARPARTEPRAPERPLDRARALDMVREGEIPVAIVIPAGFGASFGRFDSTGQAIELLADTSDPVASQVVAGLVQRTAMTAAPDLMTRQGIGMLERRAGPLTARQREAVGTWYRMLEAEARAESAGGEPGAAARGDSVGRSTAGSAAPRSQGGPPAPPAPAPPAPAARPSPAGLLEVKIVDVLGERKANPVISFYAAGIAVMFLLFSAAGAGGTLIEEVESGTLERLLTSRATMGTILAGKWLFITLLGVFQITVMFVWGMVAFRLDLLSHLPGFFVMTFFTAAAAAGFGLVLATLCRSRQQLSGLSTILILTQSALGGSMFPRFLMPDNIKRIGNFTFNAHALDGYQAVFWRDARLPELWPQLTVLAVLTGVFLAASRLLARRWETV